MASSLLGIQTTVDIWYS